MWYQVNAIPDDRCNRVMQYYWGLNGALNNYLVICSMTEHIFGAVTLQKLNNETFDETIRDSVTELHRHTPSTHDRI